MRTVLIIALTFVMLVAAMPAWAAKTMPAFKLKNLDGKKMTFDDLASGYELMAFIFWSMECAPCKEEMAEIDKFAGDYDGFRVVAVSIDSARTSSQVKGYIKGQGYDYETLLDVDGDLQKGLGIPGVPYSLLVDSAGEVLWEHSGYRKGDEIKLQEEIENFMGSGGDVSPPGDAVPEEG